MLEKTKKSYAKINLSLKVLNKRLDGYHNIESVMQMVDFGDEVTLCHEHNAGIRLRTNHPDLPIDERNIAYRAAALMQETYGIGGGFSIYLHKKIPVAAGLAGGSTNAAAVMHLINDVCGLSLSVPELQSLGVKLGADVPFCLYGKPALAEGIGEVLTPVAGLEDCYVVLVNPGVQVSTAAIYKAIDEENSPAGGDTQTLLKALQQKNLQVAFSNMKNMMEPVAIQYCPAIAELLHKLRQAGADHAMMSGSGATCFGIFLKEPAEAELKALFGKDYVAVARLVY